MKTLKRLFYYYKPYLGVMILYLILGMVIVSLAMLLPQIIKTIIASVIGDTPFSLFPGMDRMQLFFILATVYLAIILLRQGLAYLRSFLMTKSSIAAVCKMREDVFEKVLWQSKGFFREENTGNILTVANGDVEMVKNFFTATVPGIIEAIFGFIFATVMIARVSWFLVLAAFLFTVPLMIFSRRFGKVFHKWYHFVRESSADLSMVTQENINGIRIVKAYAQEEQEKKKFDEKNDAFRYHAINYMVIWGKYYIPFAMISHMPNLLVTVMAALLVISGNTGGSIGVMTIAEFVAVSSYLGYILVPFQQANNWLNAAQQAVTSAEKVFRFLNTGSAITSPKKPIDVDTSSVHLKLDHVTLSFNKKVVLNDVSIDLPQGKTLGVMGMTGSGKTTITNVMARFYDVSSGAVTINGVNVKDMDLKKVRSCFAPILQDMFLFSDTIAKNIAFGKPDATLEDVRQCAEAAQAAEFIEKMPDEYQTIVGERGMGLSGGQKQRISIARALLYGSPILIFDDATSALDMETEQKLYADIKNVGKGRSRVIVAHRVSSVKDCDEILVLDHGKIVERGSHEELLAIQGLYYRTYREQYSNVLDLM